MRKATEKYGNELKANLYPCTEKSKRNDWSVRLYANGIWGHRHHYMPLGPRRSVNGFISKRRLPRPVPREG